MCVCVRVRAPRSPATGSDPARDLFRTRPATLAQSPFAVVWHAPWRPPLPSLLWAGDGRPRTGIHSIGPCGASLVWARADFRPALAHNVRSDHPSAATAIEPRFQILIAIAALRSGLTDLRVDDLADAGAASARLGPLAALFP
ncbi:hypothetical protein pqer_cds_11 [Pandoravirus quercus]|uniref:Uncharacterized protein n=1 Tax=Pandoravirus quercus TaxID=2107709 RepID=A0A2U7U7N6_9VIRU|nr:hypothetical protein pqer_cds_11 [Pandoravirus quercus]AVK74433.1 hypothetical protein pqer_cds_11 [Pandoravirus quercus]